jgi:hypothetical protein
MMAKGNTRLDRMYANLLVEFDALGVNPSRLEFLQSLQAWLNATLRSWNPEIRNAYTLDYYASLDLSRLPISESSLVVNEEIGRIIAVKPDSMNEFAMLISRRFWEGITVESFTTCPNCEYQQLLVMEDSATNEVVLACDFCDWAQGENGEPRPETQHIQPATKEVFARWRANTSRS